MNADEFTQDRFMEAPPERIFQAITDPKHLSAWWGSDETYRCTHWEVDLRVGGKWRTEGKNASGEPFSVGGEYLEIDPPRVLAYTWEPSWHQIPATTVRWVLHPRQNGTLVIVTHSGFAGEQEALDQYKNGWPRVLGWLADYLIKE